MSVWERKRTLVKVMGELRVGEVFSRAPPVPPQVCSIKTAASPIAMPLWNEEQNKMRAASWRDIKHHTPTLLCSMVPLNKGYNCYQDGNLWRHVCWTDTTGWVAVDFCNVTLTAVWGSCGVGTDWPLVPPGHCLKDLGIKKQSPT